MHLFFAKHAFGWPRFTGQELHNFLGAVTVTSVAGDAAARWASS